VGPAPEEPPVKKRPSSAMDGGDDDDDQAGSPFTKSMAQIFGGNRGPIPMGRGRGGNAARGKGAGRAGVAAPKAAAAGGSNGSGEAGGAGAAAPRATATPAAQKAKAGAAKAKSAAAKPKAAAAKAKSKSTTNAYPKYKSGKLILGCSKCRYTTVVSGCKKGHPHVRRYTVTIQKCFIYMHPPSDRIYSRLRCSIVFMHVDRQATTRMDYEKPTCYICWHFVTLRSSFPAGLCGVPDPRVQREAWLAPCEAHQVSACTVHSSHAQPRSGAQVV
jgi:hypothetical protein